MEEVFLSQIVASVHGFFAEARLNRKKWYKEINRTDVLLYSFFVIRRRMLQSKRYKVHESREFEGVILKPEVQRDYDVLKKAWAEKGDLKKFHTENSKILNPIDGLLEDWGINHLHLDRGRHQIFFMEREREIFSVKIVKHFERSHTAYSKEHLLRIIDENWPHLLRKSELRIAAPDSIHKNYPSRYGWHKTDLLHHWVAHVAEELSQRPVRNRIAERVSVAEGELAFEIRLRENEKWIVLEKKSGMEITEIHPFAV